jgi:3-dehydroquinate dehydratase II
MRILVLNGPNLNLLGERERALYGATTLDGVEAVLSEEASRLSVAVTFFQSNHEGELIDRLHAARGREDGVIFNPGGFTHTSVALLDALLAVALPVVEVHVTNLSRREDFRRRSITAAGALARIDGFGIDGYRLALSGLVAHLQEQKN